MREVHIEQEPDIYAEGLSEYDIENMTRDQEGYILWKGQQVEHYDGPWAYSDEAKADAQETARRCAILEERGEAVSTTTVIWNWPQ